MQFGICLLSVVPCRKEDSSASEMVTQLLFGDHYTVLEQKENWFKIKIAYDNYECWINHTQHFKLNEKTFNYLQKNKFPLTTSAIETIENKLTHQNFLVSIGSCIPFLNSNTSSFDSYVFGFNGKSALIKTKQHAENILTTAKVFLNAPYLWGGKTLFGVDCSGFTQIVYKLNGFKLPRDANQQVEHGHTLNFVEEAEAGDLAFFDNAEGKIIHVGIVINSHQIIHASGFVRIDKFDHYGIYNTELGKYSHTLRVIKRIL